jgi:ATP-dependent DNA ligase
MLDGRDVRSLPLMERKNILRRVVNKHPRILYARHFERDGCDLFRLVCEQDLEGIVAKRRDAAYGEDWFKIRNPNIRSMRDARSCLRSGRKPPSNRSMDFPYLSDPMPERGLVCIMGFVVRKQRRFSPQDNRQDGIVR